MNEALATRGYGAIAGTATPKQISRVEQATSSLEKAIYDAFDAVSNLEHRLQSVLAPPPPANEAAGKMPTPNGIAAHLEELTARVGAVSSRIRAIESRLEV